MSPATPPGRWPLPVALLVVAADQGAKAWIVGLNLGIGGGPDVPGPLRITLVENPGISYGLFQDGADWTRWLFTVFALAVTVALGVWARRSERLPVALGLGLIMGGALGNVADRVFRGAVVDFIDARALGFPWIFNLADTAITVGIMLLIADSLMAPRRSLT
jgi:signal peptidase II